MRIIQMSLLIFFLLFLACEKEETITPVINGYNFEDPDPIKLNAYPILGYMQTGSNLAPLIDGSPIDNIWQYATPFAIETQAGKDDFTPTVTIKALYDNWYIYFLINWADTSKSFFKKNNFQNEEDSFSIMWNHSSTDFISCSNLCHTQTSMATDFEEFIDVWRWGINNTDTSGYITDKYLADDGFHDDIEGSMEDIEAAFSFVDGYWNLELKRRLVATLEPDSTDIEFNPDKEANIDFHIAVFNNSQGKDHAISKEGKILHFLQLQE